MAHRSTVSISKLRRRSPWTWVPSLYFAQGLPYVAVMTLSVIMYKRLGVSNTDIAFYTSWHYLPWVIKPLWSPFVDIFGTKRRWTLAMELALAVGFAAVALALPGSGFFRLSLAAFWLTGFASATHDIASDGFYMLALDSHGQSVFVGIRTTFYRVAMVTGQGLLVMLAGCFENTTGDIPMSWAMVMGALSVSFVIFALWHSWALPRPASDRPAARSQHRSPAGEFVSAFVTFFRKPGVLTALAFMLLYRLPEAQMVKLINPFLLDPVSAGGLGLPTATVGAIYGVGGIIALLAGGIAGGLTVARGGLARWVRPMAWAMSLTCLTFVWLSYAESPSLLTVNICVIVEQFGYGFGSTAYTLYLIYYAAGPYKTSHYAIATGLMALGMMLPGMAAGAIQEALGYRGFFIWTMVCCAATIAVAYALKIDPAFGREKKSAA